MRRAIGSLCSRFGRELDAPVVLLALAIGLLTGGAWMVWPPAGLLVPGALLLWIVLPPRIAFIVRTPAVPAAREATELRQGPHGKDA